MMMIRKKPYYINKKSIKRGSNLYTTIINKKKEDLI